MTSLRYLVTCTIAPAFILTASNAPAIMPSDARALCCPAAVAAKAKRMPSDANRVLRACLRAVGAPDDGATVGMRCGKG